MRTIIGIDPGLNGGIAIRKETVTGVEWYTYPMPIKIDTTFAKPVKELDVAKFSSMFDAFLLDMSFAILEYPPVISGNGAYALSSLFKMFGELRVTLQFLDIDTYRVTPIAWKKDLLGSHIGKELAASYVATNLPNLTIPTKTPRSKKLNDGIIDAVCLAEYGNKHRSEYV